MFDFYHCHYSHGIVLLLHQSYIQLFLPQELKEHRKARGSLMFVFHQPILLRNIGIVLKVAERNSNHFQQIRAVHKAK